MTKNWNTTINVVAITQPYMWTNQRAVEYSASATNVNIYLDQNGDLFYRYGDDDGFNPAANVGQLLTTNVGILVHNVSPILNASMSIDQNNDHVHIVYTDGTDVWHAECITPSAPAAPGSWSNLALGKYQLVTTNGNAIGTCDVFVDSANGNGNDEPCVVWDEQNAGTWEVWFNRPNAAGHAFNGAGAAAIALAATAADAQHPTITVNWVDGRTIYAFYVQVVAALNDDIECVRCLNAANPMLVGGWGGPVAGAGAGPDVILTSTGAGTWPTGPSTSWWSDAAAGQERVGVVAVDVAGAVQSEMWNQQAGPAAWQGPWTITGYNGTAKYATLQNILAADFRVLVQNTAGRIDHCRKATQPNMGGGDDWYQTATTASNAADPHSSEWRGIEHNDAAIAWKRSHAVFNSGGPLLFFSQVRENTSTKPPLVAPVTNGGTVYIDEMVDNTFNWTFTDTETDTQREYYVEIDDDVAFGSPVADPVSGGAYLVLNAWTQVALDDIDLEGGTLAVDTTYYWRAKTKDSEYGTEYDPNSLSVVADTGSFKTTPNFTMNITSASQQADKSCAVDFWLNLPAGVDWNEDVEITVYEYDDGGGYGAFTLDSTYHAPPAEIPSNIVITGGTEYFTIGWHAHADVEPPTDTYDETTINVRLTLRYSADLHGLGTVVDTLGSIELDFKSPASVALGTPVGGTTTRGKPTFNVSASDTNNWAFKLEVHRDAGYTDLYEASGYQAYSDTDWKMTTALDQAGTWYARTKTKDDTATANEDPAWTTGSFTFAPPPDPRECVSDTLTVEVSANREWDGTEFNIEDDVLDLSFSAKSNGFHTLSLTLNNYAGRYMDSSSSTLMEQGMELKFTRASQMFYGIVMGVQSEAQNARVVKVYCESFTSAADAYPIQIRVVDTSTSGHYWEDYVLLAMMQTGLYPSWFQFVDGDGVTIDLDTVSNDWNKTEVAPGADIVFDKARFIDFMSEVCARTNKIWYESYTTPTGIKKNIHFTNAANPSEDAVDHTIYLDSDVLSAVLRYSEENIINTVVYTDADVMEQDMDSIRQYGRHTMYRSSEGVEDMERLVEVAQYILSQYALPIIEGDVPLDEEHEEMAINELVQIYEKGGSTDDTKTGFTTKMRIVGIDYTYSALGGMKTTLILDSYWENPIIRRIIEGNKTARSSDASDPMVVLRAETAEVRVQADDANVDFSAEATYIAFRLGIDRWSDSETHSAYVSNLGRQ